jgi:hypothetical protein
MEGKSVSGPNEQIGANRQWWRPPSVTLRLAADKVQRCPQHLRIVAQPFCALKKGFKSPLDSHSIRLTVCSLTGRLYSPSL